MHNQADIARCVILSLRVARRPGVPLKSKIRGGCVTSCFESMKKLAEAQVLRLLIQGWGSAC